MPDLRISELPLAGTLDGTELVPVVVLGAGSPPTDTTSQTTVDDISNRAGVGKHAVPITASAIRPSSANGADALAVVQPSGTGPEVPYLGFPSTSVRTAEFVVPMPSSWDGGTISFRAVWSHPTASTNFGVVFSLQAYGLGDNEGYAGGFGAKVFVTDTGGDETKQYITSESSGLTVGNSSVGGDVVHFKVARETDFGSPSDSTDTLAVTARLIAVIIYITTSANTDV